MLNDDTKVNGLPVRAEIRMPFDEGNVRWLSSIIVCQDSNKGSFVVWSVWYPSDGPMQVENGIYDIPTYERALQHAYARAVS